MWNIWYNGLECIKHKNPPVWTFYESKSRVSIQPLHKNFSLSSCFRWIQWLQTFYCGRVGRGNLIWRPLNWAPSQREASTWLFRLRAPAWPCCLSGCSSKSARLWSVLFPLSPKLFLVLWCKRLKVCVWSTRPSRGPDPGRQSSSAGKTASGWASQRPPVPAYQDLSLLKDTQDVEVRRRYYTCTNMYIDCVHRGSRTGRLNKKTMERPGQGSLGGWIIVEEVGGGGS